MSGLSRVQLLRPGSPLKFIPEEILIHGRDFRLLRVAFEAGGLEPQAFQVRDLQPKDSSSEPWGSFPWYSHYCPIFYNPSHHSVCFSPQGEAKSTRIRGLNSSPGVANYQECDSGQVSSFEKQGGLDETVPEILPIIHILWFRDSGCVLLNPGPMTCGSSLPQRLSLLLSCVSTGGKDS